MSLVGVELVASHSLLYWPLKVIGSQDNNRKEIMTGNITAILPWTTTTGWLLSSKTFAYLRSSWSWWTEIGRFDDHNDDDDCRDRVWKSSSSQSHSLVRWLSDWLGMIHDDPRGRKREQLDLIDTCIALGWWFADIVVVIQYTQLWSSRDSQWL